jgi:hypothetical protein
VAVFDQRAWLFWASVHKLSPEMINEARFTSKVWHHGVSLTQASASVVVALLEIGPT